MKRDSIKEILRENIFRQHLLSEVTKRLHEEEGEGISEEELKEKYPTLYEFRKRKGFSNFFKNQASELNNEALKKRKPLPFQEGMNEKKRVSDATMVKEATKTLKEAMKSGELTPEEKEKLKQGERVAKWYKDLESNKEARDEVEEILANKFKEAGDLYRNKEEWIENHPLLQNDKLRGIKEQSTPFTVEKIISLFRTGVFNGLRNLTPGQIQKLEQSDDILKDLKAGKTPEEYEFLGKGSPRDVDEDSPLNLNVTRKMIINNLPENMQRGAAKVMREFLRKNRDTMPDAYKNDFNKFYERIKALAYELGVNTFADAFQKNEQMLRDVFEKYWRYARGEEIDYGSDNDSGGVEASDEMSDEIDDEDDDNHENPNYDPEDHR